MKGAIGRAVKVCVYCPIGTETMLCPVKLQGRHKHWHANGIEFRKFERHHRVGNVDDSSVLQDVLQGKPFVQFANEGYASTNPCKLAPDGFMGKNRDLWSLRSVGETFEVIQCVARYEVKILYSGVILHVPPVITAYSTNGVARVFVELRYSVR